jgi:two-component system response regulator DesR
MIRTLLVVEGGLARGALAYVLTAQDDIEVIGELDRMTEVPAAVRSKRPDITLIDLELLSVEDLARACATYGRLDRCRILALVELRQAPQLARAITQHHADVGFISKDAPPQRVIDGVRSLARGEIVIDGALVSAALRSQSPLTTREKAVLEVAAEGWPVREIASRFGLAPGTVRNHLSRIMAKTGARTRIQAVRAAQNSGWI